jgi:PAS domain S-box-containing protein
MNSVAESLTGWKENEAKGKGLSLVFKVINEDTNQPVENPVTRVLKEGSVVGLANHTLLITKSGKKIPIADSGSPIINADGKITGVVLVFRDQSEERKNEKILVESEEKFRRMTFNSPMGMHFYELKANNDLILVDSNPAADNLLGINHTLLIGKTIEQAFPPLAKTEVPQRYREAAFNGLFWATEQISYKDDKIEGAFEVNAYQTKPNNMVAVFADITQRKRAEEELKASEEKFAKAFYTSPDSININRLSDGLFVSVNNGFTKLTGYSREEVVGKTSFEINIWADIEDRNKLVDGLKKFSIVENLEARFKLKNGEIKDGLMSASIVELNGELHILSITRDISDRKKTDDIIKTSEANLNSLINNRNESIWSIDKDYNYITFNDFFKESYFAAYNQRLVKGLNALGLLTSELKTFWKPKYDVALSGEKIEFEFSIEQSDGVKFFQIFLNPIISDGVVTGVSALSVDITERKRSESDLQKSDELKNSIVNSLLANV